MGGESWQTWEEVQVTSVTGGSVQRGRERLSGEQRGRPNAIEGGEGERLSTASLVSRAGQGTREEGMNSFL